MPGTFPRVEAVLFDLFGTIVQPYRRREHHGALAEIAEVLRVGSDELLEGWNSTWDARATGRYPSIVDNLRAIVPGASGARLDEADRIYERFTVQSLVPKPGALDALDWLYAREVATGLVTNCAPDVPELWTRTRWAHRFDATVFSCTLGIRKPDPAIYLEALTRLGVPAEEAAFVGDGSDGELEGAAGVGLSPVLVRNADGADPEVVAVAEAAGWPVVDHLDQLPAVLRDL